jgi:hypothetical protein
MLVLAATTAAFSTSVSALASVREIELKELVERSDIIVVATVEKIEAAGDLIKAAGDEFPPVKLATAGVVETWKGPRVKEVCFVASPTVQCDITSAAMGERLVLFLNRSGNAPIMTIAHIGRGRMVLEKIKGEQFAIVEHGVELPAGVKLVKSKKPITLSIPAALLKPGEKGSKTLTFTDGVEVRSVELKVLRELVRGYLAKKRPGRLAWIPPL